MRSIYVGEKNGPIEPYLRKPELIIFRTNPIIVDLAISKILGLEYKKIPIINQSFNKKKIETNRFQTEGFDISF